MTFFLSWRARAHTQSAAGKDVSARADVTRTRVHTRVCVCGRAGRKAASGSEQTTTKQQAVGAHLQWRGQWLQLSDSGCGSGSEPASLGSVADPWSASPQALELPRHVFGAVVLHGPARPEAARSPASTSVRSAPRVYGAERPPTIGLSSAESAKRCGTYVVAPAPPPPAAGAAAFAVRWRPSPPAAAALQSRRAS